MTRATGLGAGVGVNAARRTGLRATDASGLGYTPAGWELVQAQLLAIGTVAVPSFGATLVILKVVDVALGLRVSEQAELEGLDRAEHGEVGYDIAHTPTAPPPVAAGT